MTEQAGAAPDHLVAAKVTRGKPVGLLAFNLLAILVGLVSGLGAVVFRGLIAAIHNFFFLGQFSFAYDANVHTPPSPWGFMVIFVPVVGAAGVAFLVSNFAPEAKGHGVPEVMDAIYYNNGIIRPVVAVIKSLASALSIGSGGSVGREGPIVQIGSSFGSTLGQIISMPPWQRITLIAAGAGGGIAATFNTPIGGILFALELMLHEVSARTLIPLAISTATATYLGRLAFGAHASFVIPALETRYFHVTNFWLLLWFVGLGILLGIASVVYIKSIYAFEDFFEKRMKGNYYARHMTGMLVVGIIMYALMVSQGHYYIEGVGYATIQDILTGALSAFWLLALLFAMKMLVTSLTLGSGASGGIFSPALYVGATLGAAYGIALNWCFPGIDRVPDFAIAGMAGMVGGATGAAVTAIVMIFEMTGDYGIIVPITITVAISYGVRLTLCRESIYTLKLARRGHHVPSALQANLGHVRCAKDIMQTNVVALPASTSREAFAKIVLAHPAQSRFVVHEGNRIVGMVGRDAAAMAGHAEATETLGEIASKNFLVVSGDTKLADLLNEMFAGDVSACLVAADINTPVLAEIQGVIAEHETANAMIRSVDLFSD